MTHRNRQIETIINNNLILPFPRVFKDVKHDIRGLVPNKLVIPLKSGQHVKETQEKSRSRTSENAGADTFLYLFQSRPSDATMFPPNRLSVRYNATSLGKRFFCDAISCQAVTLEKGPFLGTHLDSRRIGDQKGHPGLGPHGNLHHRGMRVENGVWNDR